jgi:hypothetical protein
MLDKKWYSVATETLRKSSNGRKRVAVSHMSHANVEQLATIIHDKYSEQSGFCPYSNVKLDFISNARSRAGDRKNRLFSVDRILSAFGYVSGNIELVAKVVQRMKGILTPTQFIAICRRVADTADANNIPRMDEKDVDELIRSL